jgi:hypothetical protein
MKLRVMTTAFALVALALATDKQHINVKDSSTSSDVIYINAEFDGRSAQLTCFLSQPNCAILKPGTYQVVRLTSEGQYTDCPNVDIYPISAKAEKGKKLGEYCLN